MLLRSLQYPCCTALVLCCCCAESRNAKEIKAVSDEIARAFETREFGKVDGFFTEDFRCSLYGGATILNREQFLHGFKQEAERALPPVRVSIKLSRFRVQADSATATWSEVTEYSLASAQGSKHRFRYSQQYHSQLAKKDGKWKFASITYPKEGADKTLDGEPVSSDELARRLGR